MKRVVTFLMVVAVLAFASSAVADVIVVDETFSTDGLLVGTTPSPGPGGEWATHSGTEAFIMVTSGEAVLTHGGGSREDANTSFAALTSGIIKYTYDFSVDDLGGAFNGTDFEYFSSFGATGFTGDDGSTLVGRVDVVSPTGSGDFTVGIATTEGFADAVWGTDFSYGETVSVAVDYNIDTNQAFLSVNGGTAIAGAMYGANTTSIDDFSLRQSNSTNDETIRVDNLVVTVIPEPSSCVVLMACATGLFIRRRR